MDIQTQEMSTRKPTAIPRLKKKSSFDSAFSGCVNDHQQENTLNRCSSDPNHNSNKPDKNKQLFKFTLKEKLLNCVKNDDGTTPNNNDTDDEINSAIFSGRSEDKQVKNEKEHEETIDESFLLHKQNQTTNNSTSTMTSTGTLVQTQIECSCQTLTPNSGQNIKINEDQVNSENQPSFNQFLKEAYIKQIGKNAGRHNQILDQSCWNIMNPLYKNVGLSEDSKLKANLVSDVNVDKLSNHKEESSDFETEEETLVKDLPQVNTKLYQLYKSLTAQKSNTNETTYNRQDSLVKAFLQMFDEDSALVQKLRKDSKMDNRIKKFKGRLQRKDQNKQNNLQNCKSKLIQDIYKNDDVFSSITHSSVDNWSSYQCTPKRCISKQSCRRRSNVSVKGCGCEIRHLQLNDVQNSITDIQKGMKMMLANYSPTTNEEIALELVRMRIICDECIAYHRKAVMQNKKLQNEVQSLCETISKLMEGKKSRWYLKLLTLPLLGAAAYYVVKNFELFVQNPKIPVLDDE